MKDKNKTKAQLINELAVLHQRVTELETCELEHIRTEKSLQESERKLFTLMGNLPGMAYRCLNDENWTMEFISEGCVELTGYNPLDLIALAERRPFRVVYRIQTATGEQKWVWEQGVGVFSDEGDLQALEGFITDITRLRRTEISLQESERKLSTLMGNLPGMAYRCLNDENWTMEFISEGCVELTGYNPLDLIGNRKLSYGELIHPDDQGPVWNQCIVFKPQQVNRNGCGNREWGSSPTREIC
jgi:PAS domain-containing protein